MTAGRINQIGVSSLMIAHKSSTAIHSTMKAFGFYHNLYGSLKSRAPCYSEVFISTELGHLGPCVSKTMAVHGNCISSREPHGSNMSTLDSLYHMGESQQSSKTRVSQDHQDNQLQPDWKPQ